MPNVEPIINIENFVPSAKLKHGNELSSVEKALKKVATLFGAVSVRVVEVLKGLMRLRMMR